MIRHTDGNLHALDAHERRGGDAEFAALAKQVEAALVGRKYYELADDFVFTCVVASVTVHDEHRSLLRVTIDDDVACWVNDKTCEISSFADDDRYYVTREEAEEALREVAE